MTVLILLVMAVVVLVVLAGGGALIWYLVRSRLPVTAGRTMGAAAPAAIVAFRRSFSPFGGTQHYARVFFTTRLGQQVTTEVYLSSIGFSPRLPGGPVLRVGERIWVDYDVNDPRRAEARGGPPVPGR